MDALVQLISSVGFPIAACVYMAYFQNNTINGLRETINQNTIIMEKLAGKLDLDTDRMRGGQNG